VAAHRKRIEKVVEIFKQSGLRIQVIDYGLCALVRLHNHIHPLTDAPSVLVHMDESATMLAVATTSEIVAHRQLDWGIGRLGRRIANALQLDDKTQQPRSMLLDYGVDYDALQDGHGSPREEKNPSAPDEIAALRVVSQILVPSMEELVRELFQIIGYARSLSPQIQFRELWLYGRANEIRNIGPFLEKRLRIPAHAMTPFEKIALANMAAVDADDVNAYVGALGLSLRGAQ
jgi:Tfp pilus assembly PilM family ATPase